MSSKVRCQVCREYFPKGEIKYTLPLGNICSDECLKKSKKKPPKHVPESKASREVRKEAGGRCVAGVSPKCQGVGNHIHHRQMRSQGGKNTKENLVLICDNCHMLIHHNPRLLDHKDGLAYETGWLVKSWQDPAEVKTKKGRWPHV